MMLGCERPDLIICLFLRTNPGVGFWGRQEEGAEEGYEYPKK